MNKHTQISSLQNKQIKAHKNRSQKWIGEEEKRKPSSDYKEFKMQKIIMQKQWILAGKV